MKGVLLDAATLGEGIDFTPLASTLSDFTHWPITNSDEVAERIQDAEVVMTNKVVLDRSLLQQATGVRLICVMATGTNNVDLQAAEELGIAVRNVQAYGTASVAQHTMMLMLALATRLAPYKHAVEQGQWQRSTMFCLMDYPVLQLQGKTLLLVGHGELGRAVEKLAQAFGMEVMIAARPGVQDDPRPNFDSLLPQADVISFHCPLTEATRHLLHAGNLPQCKPQVLVVNTARGGIVHEADALSALQKGQIGGLAVDVLSSEPPTEGNPLLDTPSGLNLLVTPHSAWLAPEARQRIIELTAANIQQFSAAR